MAVKSGNRLHVPQGMSPTEEAKWWDEHVDQIDWEAAQSEVAHYGPVERTVPVMLRLPDWMVAALRREAAKTEYSYQWLIRTWLEERLQSIADAGADRPSKASIDR
jgi:predicted DNA binding CopG/RHH family protein